MNQPKSLRELVELAIQYRSASGLGLSQLATKNGHKLTATTINAIRQGTYKYTPKDETLRALAWLADVDASVAFMAAGQPVPGPPFAEELPPGVDNLPPKARKAAIDMLRVLVDMNQDADHAGNAQHPEPAERLTDPRTGRHFRRGSAGEEHHRQQLAAEKSRPGDSSPGQKTGQPIFSTTDSGSSTKNEHSEHDPADDGNIPLPEDYVALAAHPATDSSGRREHEAGRERGEESQDDQDVT